MLVKSKNLNITFKSQLTQKKYHRSQNPTFIQLKPMKKLLIICILGGILSSCSTKQEVLYFQNLHNENFVEIIDSITYPKIESSDILDIRITALEQKSIIPFQFEKPTLEGSSTRASNRGIAAARLEGYLVDKDGNINYPQLGKIQVSGLTTQEVEEKVEKLLSSYITDPTVAVRLVNFKVSILGEVTAPGTYSVDEGLLTLPQALGMAGDLSIKGRRENVLIIRNQGDRRQYKYIDLTKTDWLNSDYYFLKQGDIVYVEPNKSKVKEAGFVTNVGTVMSVISFLISMGILIAK